LDRKLSGKPKRTIPSFAPRKHLSVGTALCAAYLQAQLRVDVCLQSRGKRRSHRRRERQSLEALADRLGQFPQEGHGGGPIHTGRRDAVECPSCAVAIEVFERIEQVSQLAEFVPQ